MKFISPVLLALVLGAVACTGNNTTDKDTGTGVVTDNTKDTDTTTDGDADTDADTDTDADVESTPPGSGL